MDDWNIAPVGEEEARFLVRFAYTSELMKKWNRHPVRTSRKVWRVVMWIIGSYLVLYGLWRLGEIAWSLWSLGTSDMLAPFVFTARFLFGEAFFPLLYIGVGVLGFFLDSIRLTSSEASILMVPTSTGCPFSWDATISSMTAFSFSFLVI